MEHLGVVDEEELDHVCSERETALDRPLHQWEREVLPKLYSGPTIQSRSAARRAAQDLVSQILCNVWPQNKKENLSKLIKKEGLGNTAQHWN